MWVGLPLHENRTEIELQMLKIGPDLQFKFELLEIIFYSDCSGPAPGFSDFDSWRNFTNIECSSQFK